MTELEKSQRRAEFWKQAFTVCTFERLVALSKPNTAQEFGELSEASKRIASYQEDAFEASLERE